MHHVTWQWGEETCRISSTHTGNTWGNIFLARATSFQKEDNLSQQCLVSLISVPLQARSDLVSDGLSMVLWCNDLKPKRPGPQLICITIHSQHIFSWLQVEKSCSTSCVLWPFVPQGIKRHRSSKSPHACGDMLVCEPCNSWTDFCLSVLLCLASAAELCVCVIPSDMTISFISDHVWNFCIMCDTRWHGNCMFLSDHGTRPLHCTGLGSLKGLLFVCCFFFFCSFICHPPEFCLWKKYVEWFCSIFIKLICDQYYDVQVRLVPHEMNKWWMKNFSSGLLVYMCSVMHSKYTCNIAVDHAAWNPKQFLTCFVWFS